MNLWNLRFNELDCGALQNSNHRRVRFDMREHVGSVGEGEVDISYAHTCIQLSLSDHKLTATPGTGALKSTMEIKLDGRCIGKMDTTGLLRVNDNGKSTLRIIPDSRERRFLWARVQGLNLWQAMRYANEDYALLVADDAVLATFAGNPFNGAPLLCKADTALMADWSEEKQWCAFVLCIRRLGQYRLHQNRAPRLEGRAIPNIPSCAVLGSTTQHTLTISPQDWGNGPTAWDIVLERATRWGQLWLVPLILLAMAYAAYPDRWLGGLLIVLTAAWLRSGLLPEKRKAPQHFSLHNNP